MGDDETYSDRHRRAPRPFWWRLLLRSPRDSVIAITAAAAVSAIIVNSLFLQPGPHPAPIFAIKPPPAAIDDSTGGVTAVMPRPRPDERDIAKREPSPPARMRAEMVTDIQRELARRGFYDGPVDGVYGSKTDAAIREFELSAGLKPSGEPSEALLQAIIRSNARAKTTPSGAISQRKDPIAELISAPSHRILAVQRALAEYGYGQIKSTGTYDADTRAAIQRFERDRRLPITGEINERLTRELAALTGRPLE